ncbi:MULTISPECIES: DNA recombination protein RmuC [Cryobacterium]|uniref:DNA recombination protein RmuC n=1 Tax=Cryobacterium breve TaxID=1259258 RepID=A0ABY2J383_9MICO|nr:MULTISPECIES: DNA recombination protein RmuC [Cryobacterium]TFC91000.1 DNA recombination protein RmuC [Cryobacterium sp. TmT3-12]TFC99319.1 DNA recombination protein RmuC [Cryobacterium breve]
MDSWLSLLLGLVVGALLGTLFTIVLLQRRGSTQTPDEGPAVVEARHALALSEVRASEATVRGALQSELSAALATVDGLTGQIDHHRDQYRELTERRDADQQEQNERERREHLVLEALSPVKETLRTMQQKVTELETQRSEQYGSLSEQLKQAQLSDEQLRVTTESLASALRSNSTRGVWGETQLRRVVEAAGLAQYVDFTTQSNITTDAGLGRPDMVVRLPGNKSIAIDAKVPLEHYIEASTIALTATGEEGARRKTLVDKHVKAVRAHIDALAKKTYWEGFDASPEFVIAFIPSESLLSSALEADPSILDYSFSKRVALASPVNLWAVLKTVAFTWQQQAVTDEAKKLFDLGNALYQRLGTLSGHAEGLRKALERTVDSYNKFANSLETRVLVTARQFPGIDETKISLLAEPAIIHDSPRKLTAPEFGSPEIGSTEFADELVELDPV